MSNLHSYAERAAAARHTAEAATSRLVEEAFKCAAETYERLRRRKLGSTPTAETGKPFTEA